MADLNGVAPRWRVERREDGFTLIELVVALTIIAGVLVSAAYLLTGAMGAYGAARQRSNMVEVANGVMESLRAASYETVAVTTNPAETPPAGMDDGRDPVIPPAAPAASKDETINPSDVPGVLWYRVERWVTWTDADAGTDHEFKRLQIRVSWPENADSNRLRSFELSSLLYPGGLGTPLGPGSNVDPDAQFTYLPAAPAIGATVQFTNTSTDSNGDALTYVWTIDGTTSTTTNPTYTFTSVGTYPVTLQVPDGNGGLDTLTQNVVVTGPNAPPTASFTVTTPPGRPDVVTVDASGSTDPEGATLSYSWDFGDGSPSTTGQLTTHRYLSTGPKTITLTVSDPSGGTSTTSQGHNVPVVGCTVISGEFKNPATNATANSISVSPSNGKPDETGFAFTAVTTNACTSLSGRLPLVSGTFTVNLSPGAAGATKTWTGADVVPASARFNLGTNQTAQFWAGLAGVDEKFSFSFSVVG